MTKRELLACLSICADDEQIYVRVPKDILYKVAFVQRVYPIPPNNPVSGGDMYVEIGI